jgi:hypothetical protein
VTFGCITIGEDENFKGEREKRRLDLLKKA